MFEQLAPPADGLAPPADGFAEDWDLLDDPNLRPPSEDGDDPPHPDDPPVAAPFAWSEHVPDGWLADMMSVAPARPREENEVLTFGCYDTLERVGGWERVIGWAQGNQLRQVAAFVARATVRFERPADRPEGMWDSQLWDAVVAEVGLMLRVSTQTARSRVGDALALVGSLPATLAALEAGTISLPSARAIVEETRNLDVAQAAEVEAAVLEKAGTQAPGQIRTATRRAVAAVDADAVRRRHQRAKRDRGVWLLDDPDGMATLLARLPAPEAVGAFAVLDEYARRAGGAHDDRTLDARRADAMVDLILDQAAPACDCQGCGCQDCDCATTRRPTPVPDAGDQAETAGAAQPDTAQPGATGSDTAQPGAAESGNGPFISAGSARAHAPAPAARRQRRSRVSVQVRVTVPYSTLLGIDELPGELAGYGPIPPDVARELAAQGTWRRILTDPATGALLDVGTTRYRPPPSLAEYVIARSQTCEFPGCQVPAHRCDLDHRIPYEPEAGVGPTSDDNIGPKCRGHHQVKQMPGWSVTREPDGTVRWRTPTGHEYTTAPPPVAAPKIIKPPPDPDEPPPF